MTAATLRAISGGAAAENHPATTIPSNDCAAVSESGNTPVKTQTNWSYTGEYLARIRPPVSVDNLATTVGLRRSDQGV